MRLTSGRVASFNHPPQDDKQSSVQDATAYVQLWRGHVTCHSRLKCCGDIPTGQDLESLVGTSQRYKYQTSIPSKLVP